MKEINSRIESLSPAKRAILEQRLREKQDDDGLIPRVMIPGRSHGAEASDEASDGVAHAVTLSSAQRRLWFIDQVAPGNAAYNRPTHFRLTGELQADALAQSLSAIVQRHRVLRMTFRAVAGEPVGVVGPALDIPLPVVDLAGLDETAQAAQIQQIAWQAGQHPFDLSQGPLLRAQLLRLGAQTHILLVNIHHIVFDGWSVSVFQASLAHFYQAFVTGQPVTLPALPLQYDDFAQWQQQRLSSAELAPQLDYWKSQLQGELPVLDLSASLSSSLSAEQERQGRQLAGQSVRQSGVGSEGRSYVHTLPPALGDRLQAFSQREGVTLFMTLLAAFQTLLYRYTQQSDVVVGTPVAGRDRIELEPLIGVFINTLALRTSFEQKPTCQQLLRQVQKTTLEAYAHQMLPFEKLVEEIQPERQAGQTPIFQTLLQLRNLPNERLVSGELEIEPFKLDRTFVDLDLSVDIVECSEGLVCTFLYRSELFDEATIRRMAGHFQRLLESFVATPTAAVDELPLLTDSEHHQLLTQWQGQRVGLPDELCVHRLIEAQVEKTPDAIAVAYESETLTYRELNDQASQLGRFLQRKGVGPDQRVGLCVVRSPQMLVGLLAILKAGGAYVPIDPSYPQSRIDFILSDAQVSALLTSTAIAERLALATTTSTDGATDGSADGSVTALTVVCLDDDTWNQESLQAAGQPVENCGGDVQPHNLAYVIYTSGSTGQPKGVMVEHRSVVNLAIALERELSAAALPSVASQSLPQGPPQSSPHTPTQPPLNVSLNGPLAFDTSVKQIVQLLGGHRLEVVPDALRFDGKELLAFLQQRKIDRFDCTPSQLQLLVEAGLLDCAGAPAQILVGGEPIGRELWARLAHAKHSQFYNVYGPTECTVDATICQILPTEKPATIGQALANVQLYNLDAQRRPVPVGVPGELYVGGHGLARGYLNRPELTAERFVAHSFRDRAHDHSPIRLYKTGDRVRFLPGGRVEYIGRIDNQVKLRGHRIELGEIETALAQHPLVSAAVVILDGGNKRLEEKRLVGYVASEAALTGSELYQSLKGKLPDYMVPAAFVVLERLPLTANGKIDRRSLPAPDPSQRVLKTEFVAPRDDLEQRLAEMWAELLPAEQIGIDDNFFELGGHSLLATRVVARVHAALGVEVPVVDLFEHVTIAQLGARIRELQASVDAHSNGSGQIVPLVARCDRSQPIPASSTQQRWWFFEQLETDSSLYNRPRLFKLRQSLPLSTVRDALDTIVRRHEVIRTTLQQVNGELRQIVHEAWTLPLPVVELDSSQVGKEQVLNSYVEQAVQQSFDLSQDLMLRGAFLVLNAKASEADHRNGKGMDGSERYLLLVMHHAISDHWTLDLLLTELTALCEERCEERCEGECEERCEGGLSAPLPALPIQYADFALWQQRQFQQRDFQSHLDYWTQQLSGEPTILDLPLDHSQHKETSRAGQIQRLVLSPHLLSQLKTLSQQHNATLFMTLLAAFKVLLYRYTQQTDIIVGVPVAGRQLQSCENLLGCFLNTLAFRTNLAGGPSFALLLQSVRTVSLEAYAHQHCPFEKVIEQLQIERDFSQSPLFNVVFDYINTPQSAAVESDNLPLTPVKVDRRVALFDLTLYLEETAQGFEILFEYSQACFEPATISRMKAHFQTLLESIVADPSQSIDRLMLLTPAARQQQLFAWNQTQTDYPRNECVHELFEAQVARQPSAIAATLNQQKITYQQLNQRANQLARYLQTLGARPGSLIGLYLNRSLEMLVGMLAILKAGGAYVTLDPEYPAERLTFMLEDTQISILLGQASLSQNSPFQSRATLIDLEGALEQNCSFLGSFSYNNLPCNTTPEDLAYVIYTSGSTGRPKGVTIPHRAVNRLVCQTNYIDIQPSDRVAQVSNASFDAAPFEIWSALLNGAQLVLIDKAVLLSPRTFSAQLREHRVSSLLLTTALFNQVASVRPETFSGLRYLLFGGEAADPKWVRTVLEKGKPQRLIHAYGPAENTTISTCYEVTAVSEADTTVPIGTPIANTQVYILSDRLEPVPMGVVGELYVGGDGLARGYLNRPELTAERFVHHPFSAAPNARLYKTGDLARYLADGEIEFIGRKDHQVKIRGFRIELGEIGTVLAQHPLVGDELIVVQDLPNGEKRLVAYVTPREASPSSRDLRQFLQTRLPGYMVPSAFTVLDRFPLTPNGKVDRQALPEPAEGLLANKGDFVAPRTKTEKQLGQIWCGLLHLDAVGLRDSFFELGGHSLLATRLSSQIQDVFAVEIPLKTVFESPTLEELSMVVEEAIARPSHSAQKVTIPTASREERLSLSFAQQRLWFLNQLENKAQSTTYNITCTLQLEGLLVASVLKQAISEIVQRHESLRTVFPLEGNEPVQRVLSAASVHIPVADLQLSTEFEQIEQIGRLVDELGRTPFDLGGSRPLISFRLVKRSAQQHVLIMAMHHIISDGWSVDIFKRELSALYHDFIQGKSASLPALSVQYADFAHWQRQQLQGDRLTEQLAYWQQQLADAPKLLTFPTDYSRPPVQDFAGAAIAFKLDSDLSQQLAELSAKNGTTLYMTLLAAFSTLLYRYSHAEDIVVGSPIANRTQRDIEPLIGFFANTLPMRTRLGDNPSFLSLLEQVKQTALAAYEHQDLPFEKLVEVLNPERTLSYHPVFQVVFSLQNESPLALTTPSLTIRDWEKAHSKIAVGDRAKFDLGLSMVATADGLEGTWRYATALFESETIHRLQVAFQTLLSSIVEQPETPVSKLSILSEADRQKLLFDWTNTRADYPRDQAVHQLFEQQVALTPDAIAVRFKDCSLTYTALNQRANQLAHYLKDLDIEPGDLIGLYMERSLEMIVSIVAILKAGGAYVPLDTSYPSERIAFILQDSKVSILLTQSHLSMAVAEIVSQVVEVDRLFLSDHDATSRSNLFLNPVSVQKTFEDRPADQLAYVMYTSGSTGTPKGVCVRHRSISRLVKNTNFVSIDSEDVFLQLAPIAFDAATFSIWGALLNGASVVLFPHAKPSPETIAETVAKHQVTMFFVTAGLFHVMVDHGLKGLESTRQMLFGGDVTSVAHVRQARSQLPNCTFINGYGPTENTTFTTCYPVPRTAPIEQPIPIGYPISNTCTYVLDEHLQPVPIGVYGELYAGGDGVAAGYLHRPELTQERFIQNPFSQDGADTLYKTGDLARYRADGSIEFAGRLDHQVKVRGFRIELGEIETALERHPQIEKTVVVVWERQPGDKRLIVYMTCLGRPPSSHELSRFLKQSLPSYMVPATFIAVEQLPLTPNGKVDRRSLPQPDHFVRELDTDLVEPQTQLQAQLAAIWQELLSLDAVGIHDNFFELGGHSLLATQVISRVRTALSVALPVRSLFEEPTIAGLAALIEAGHRSSREVPELSAIEPASRDLSLPLSFAQQRLWFLSQLEETGATYNVPTVLELSGPLDSAALERAVYTIAQRHEVLRTTFQLVDGQPMQLIHDELPLELPKIDLRSHPLQKQTDTVRQLSNQLAHAPFDLSQDFPLRAQLIQLERDSHVLILVLHHIVADGWSMSIFLRELVLLYREQAEGVAAALAPLPIQYADFAYWQRQWLQGEVRSRQLSYWQQQLAGAPERLMLPADYDYPTVRSPKGATLTFQLSPALTRQLNRLSQQRETTLFMTLLAAFSVFLYRYSDRYSQQGQPATDIVVGTPIANRNRQEIEPLIGFFANTLLMRTKVENNPRFSEVLQQVRQGALEAYAHQDLPFEMLVEVLRPARTLSHNPLFQVMFALQTAAGQQREQPSEPLRERQTNNLPCRPHPKSLSQSPHPKSLSQSPHPKSLSQSPHPKSLSQSPHPKSLSQRERDFRSDSLLPSGEGLGMRALEISQTDTPLKRTSLSDQQNSSQARSLSIRKREVEWNAAKFDLNLSMTKTEKGLKGRWNYSTDLFKPETASFMVNQFQALLESIVATPDQPVDELSLLSAQAQQTLAQSQQKSARLAAKIATLSPAKRSLLEQKLRSQQKGRQSADMLPRQRQSVGSPNGANGTGGQSAELTITEAPLSFSQQNLWLLDQLNPGNPAFNRPTHIRLAGNLDISALEASLAALVRRHDVLRTHFQLSSAGEPVQIISPRLPAEISLIETLEDISHLPASEQTDALKRQAIAQAHTLFDLTALPLFKLRLLRLSDTEHILLWTFHHIIFDGWSTGILIKDLAALYQAAMTGQPADLPPLAIQYADFALRQQRSLKTAAMATQLAYWKKQLSGHLPILELPTDRPRRSAVAKGAETKGAEYTFELSQSLKHQLSTFAQREQSTLFMVLLAGFKTLLYRYTQAEDVIVGSPIAGRNAVETENLIGLFFNTLVLRSQLTGAQSFQSYLQQVRQTALDAYAHQDIPLPKLVEALQIERDPSRSNLFQVLFQFKNLPSEAVGADGAAGGLSFSDSRLETDIASLELALEISEQAEGLSCLVKYDAALFDGATIQRMGEHFRTLLESALKNPRQSLDALLLLPAAERQRLLQWSSAEADLPGQPQVDTGCIHRLFEAQVLRQPGAIALTYQQQQLTYQALNRRANQLAHRLSKLGVGPDVPVGIYLARSPDLLIALLAVLKAGGAYVPLDADALPIERVMYVLADTQTPVLITHSELCEALPTSTAAQVFTQICIDTDQAEIALESAENLADFASPTDLAYVIYTSGSTGQPKGTMVEHHSLVDAFWSWEQAYQLPQLGSHLQLAGFSFDVFTADWVRSLCSGAELVLCPADYRLVPQKLYHLLQTAQIACAEFVPGVIRLLMQHLTETGQSLDFMQLLIVGSDTWYMREYRQLQAVCGAHTRLVNSYGLTEDTVDSTFFESAQPEGLNGQRPELAEDALVPIGRPFANTQLHILDGQLQPVPIGIPGELYISGSGLARGYLNRAELTAQRFMEPAGYPRLYKTGDRARYLNDGNVEFLGRLDFQVKLRGFRIELGEIEAALARSPEVQQCVVVLRADGADQQRLIAYWMPVTRQSQTVTPNELKQRLKQSLPDYMVPAAFVALDAFPLTPSGKINRQALPTPDPTQRTSDAAFVAPRSPTEQQLAQIWCELLNLEQVSIHDDFFDLGGHSLLAVHLVARIRQTFNSELPLSSLFRDKSIAQLATRLTPAVESAATKDGTEQPPAHTLLVEIQPGNPCSLPIFFVHPIGGSVFCYQALAHQLATDRAIYGLQAPTMTNDLRYQSIENMATDYIQAIRRVQPKGPYQLGGWSMGGVIAYEMAQQLAKQGDEVLPIVMIDSRVPTGNTGGNISTGRPSKRLMVLFARDLGCSVSQTQQIDRALSSPDASASAERAIARLYVALQQFERLPPTLSQSELQHLLQLFTYHLNMLKSYTPRSYAGSVTLFKAQTPVRSTRAADDTGDRTWPQDYGWRQLVQGALVVHTVPGSHYSMMRSPTVATLADRLSQFLMQYSSRLPCSP